MAKDEVKYLTPRFRLAFPHPFDKTAMEGGVPKYGFTAIWTPGEFTEAEKVLWKALGGALNDASMTKFKKAFKDLKAPYKKGLRDGDETEERAAMDGFGPGTKFANLTSNFEIGVVGPPPDKIEISREEGNEDEIYPGCVCRATVAIYAYDKNGGKGIAIGARSLQKINNKGARFDIRASAASDYNDDDVDESWLDGPVDASTEFEGPGTELPDDEDF